MGEDAGLEGGAAADPPLALGDLPVDQLIWRSFIYLEALDRRTLGALDPPLTSAQYHALGALELAPGNSLGDLAARLLCAKATASDLIDRLARLGLVSRQRADQDARRLVLTLTHSGQAALAAARLARLAALRQALTTASPPDQVAMARALAQLTALLQAAVLGGPAVPLSLPDAPLTERTL